MCGPLGLVYVLAERFAWIEKHKAALGVVVWLLSLAVLHLVFMPAFGVHLNPNFEEDP